MAETMTAGKKLIDPMPIICKLADRALHAKGTELSLIREVIDLLMAAEDAADIYVGDKWVPTAERLPEERDSFFARFYGTERWMPAMFRKVSDEVIVCIKYKDGSTSVKTAKTHDGEWDISSIWAAEVTHWMPLPAPAKECK